jgi:hypothetical protein
MPATGEVTMSVDRAVQRELRFFRAYGAVSAAALIVLSIAAFRGSTAGNTGPARFDEIDVHRINIVEPDGKVRMIISDKAHSAGPIDHGKPFGYPGGTRPGIIFFNDEESEDGGLVYDGQKANGQVAASAQLSFDQYGQDQFIYLQYAEERGQRSAGLYVDDNAEVPNLPDMVRGIYALPAGPARDSARRAFAKGTYNGLPLYAHRVFIGRDPVQNAIVRLDDRQGRTRLRILVDSLGSARIEFLDDQGRVVRAL